MAKDRKQTGTDSQAERDLREEQARARGEQDTSDERPGATAGPERHATPVQREGMDLLGRSSVRDGAIPGVSDASARADQRSEPPARTGTGEHGIRRNPPLREDGGGLGAGGISASGGVAGGARGHGGSSVSVDSPEDSPDAGDQPAEHKSTSRTDLDRTDTST